MRIVIVGSSLVYNNPSRNDSYQTVYGFILKEYLKSKGNHDIFIFGRAKNHTRMQRRRDRLFYDLEQFEPDIVIIHLGVVDCAPRLFLEHEQIFLQSLPKFLRLKLIKFLSNHRDYFTRKFKKEYVSINDFEHYFQKILDEIRQIHAIPIIINISKPNQYLINRSYLFLENVIAYNKILLKLARKNHCNIIDVYSLIESQPSYQLADGIHLSKSGNKKLANLLITEINSLARINIKLKLIN